MYVTTYKHFNGFPLHKINYKVNSFEADLISLLYMMVYPFVTPISSFIVDNYSMRLGVNII